MMQLNEILLRNRRSLHFPVNVPRAKRHVVKRRNV